MGKVCSCRSGKLYINCCRPFHKGKLPHTALELMRSRFSAYCLGLSDYIIETTHPANSSFNRDHLLWAQRISEFCKHTEFHGLEILDFHEKLPYATVTFTAHLLQNGKDVSFSEKSYFEKTKGKWLYRNGELFEKNSSHVVMKEPLHILPFAYYEDPILRKVATPLSSITPDIANLVDEMVETMDTFHGIGLAAPQINHSIRLFVIRRPVDTEGDGFTLKEVKVFINPKLSQPSSETWTISEGCLSIPSIRAEVERPKEITVEYQDLKGNHIKERVSGWEARVIMHENDHLNGVLFIDHVEQDQREQLEPILLALKNRIETGIELK